MADGRPPQRVWVFIDAQNLYRDARRAFHPSVARASDGQVDPIKLANLLADRPVSSAPATRVLDECRIYTGVPSPNRDPKSSAAHQRQRAAWEASGAKVIGRSLRYPKDWPSQPAQEKGVDVSLAVDVVFNGARRNYDVGIIVSTDTDLVPAIEAVSDLQRAWGAPRIEVACWTVLRKRLRLSGRPLWAHHLERADYDLVRDPTDYSHRTI